MLSGLATGVEFSLEGWPLLGVEFHTVQFRSSPFAAGQPTANRADGSTLHG